jgi:glyceraldehyde-3-phosphate dehydrogenase/erythrose-4-phosphate dehydrogenase
MNKTRVAVNGYGVIGKRIADAVRLQDDLELVGVADVVSNYRLQVASARVGGLRRDSPGRRCDACGRHPGGRRPA